MLLWSKLTWEKEAGDDAHRTSDQLFVIASCPNIHIHISYMYIAYTSTIQTCIIALYCLNTSFNMESLNITIFYENNILSLTKYTWSNKKQRLEVIFFILQWNDGRKPGWSGCIFPYFSRDPSQSVPGVSDCRRTDSKGCRCSGWCWL